jgi:NRPS condensation-like uncharacterized protein
MENSKRKLTGEENIFFRAPEANVSLVIRLKGRVDEDNLKLALTGVAKIHPLLHARCITDENQDAWFIIDEPRELTLKVLPRNLDDDWKTAIQNEYRTPFDFEKGPLIRFVLLKSSETSDLLIYCQHTICDGLSLSHLAACRRSRCFYNEKSKSGTKLALILANGAPSSVLQGF